MSYPSRLNKSYPPRGAAPSQKQYAYYHSLRTQLLAAGHSGQGYPDESEVGNREHIKTLIDRAKKDLSALSQGDPPTTKQLDALRSMHRRLARRDPSAAAGIDPESATTKQDASALFTTLHDALDDARVRETVHKTHNPAWTPGDAETGSVWSKEDRGRFDQMMLNEVTVLSGGADPRSHPDRLRELWGRASRAERDEMQRRLEDSYRRRDGVDTDPTRPATSPEDALARLIAASGGDRLGKVTGPEQVGEGFAAIFRDAEKVLAPSVAALPSQTVADVIQRAVGDTVHADAANQCAALGLDQRDSSSDFAASQGAQEYEHQFAEAVDTARDAHDAAPMYPVPVDSAGTVIDPDTGKAPESATGGVDPADGKFYMVGDQPCLVVRSKSNGNLYAKTRIPGEKGWHYAPGKITELRASGKLMSVAEAEAVSAHLGFCYACGRTLYASGSVKRGIGPVCRKKFG